MQDIKLTQEEKAINISTSRS